MHTVDDHEREVKFFIADLKEISSRLLTIGAVVTKERVHEYNLRFDTPDQKLRSKHQVLRLRQDDQTRLTFKDRADVSQGVADRQELEITVADFKSTQKILEALGFTVFMIYEKFRTTYGYKGCEIVVDELPFGFFVEIEGATEDAIKTVASDLKFNWEKRILLSYLDLFNILKINKDMRIVSLTFDNFAGTKFTEADFVGKVE